MLAAVLVPWLWRVVLFVGVVRVAAVEVVVARVAVVVLDIAVVAVVFLLSSVLAVSAVEAELDWRPRQLAKPLACPVGSRGIPQRWWASSQVWHQLLQRQQWAYWQDSCLQNYDNPT